MRPIQKMFLATGGLSLLLAGAACSDPSEATAPVAEAFADHPSLKAVSTTPGKTALVAVGDTVRVSTNLQPTHKVTWRVNDGKVLRSLSGGRFVALAEGGTFVVASAPGNKSESTLVIVQAASPVQGGEEEQQQPGQEEQTPAPVAVASVSVALSPLTVEVGQGAQATATLKDADGATLTGRTVTWSTSSASVATVSSTGAIKAVAAGTATITATSEGKTGSATLTVSAPAPSYSGTPIYPGESIQSKVNAAAAGTRFVIKAGVHSQQSITPKDGQEFIGEPGAVLDGGRVATRAFGGSARNVVIKGLVIRNYATASQQGTIHGDNTTGWLVENNEIRDNGGTGLRTGNRMRVLRNHIHHNTQLGMGGRGDSVLVEGNEIAYNNHARTVDYNWEAGATKFARTRWLIVRDNYVHDNWGPGLWTDIDNLDALIEGNRVERNAAAGIFHEISYRAVIRNNTVTGNGFNETWLNGAGILVNSSPNVEVYGNTLSGNRNGIIGSQGSRGTGAYGEYLLMNLNVHHNKVTTLSGASGIAIYGGASTAVFSSARNNRWSNNTYWLGSNSGPFTWEDRKISDAQWRSLGMDTGGTFNR